MAKPVTLENAGVYEVIEAYRMPYYLAAAFEAVVTAGRFGVPVRTDLARALAYLNRLQRCTSDVMKPKPAPHAVQRRLPPGKVAERLVGAGKWPGSWQHASERMSVAERLLAAVCQRRVIDDGWTLTGKPALERAAEILSRLLERQPVGRDVFGQEGFSREVRP